MSNAQTVAEGEFPFLAETPRRSTVFSRAMDVIRSMQEAQSKHGTLIPAPVLTAILGVSKQRVHQIIAAGDLVSLDFHGRSYVTEASLKAYIQKAAKDEHHQVKMPKGNLDLLKRSFALTKELIAVQKGK